MISSSKSLSRPRSESNIILGLIYLAVDILVSVTAQLALKNAMLKLGGFNGSEDWTVYLWSMVNVEVIGGMLWYGLGMVLWILCLSKLDLSLAYPIGTLQYILIFTGAWWLFDEQITVLRLIGMLVICLGAYIMSIDLRKK